MKMIEYFKFRNHIIKEYLIFSIIVISFFTVLGKPHMVYGFMLGSFISGVSFFIMSITNLSIITQRKKFQIIKWLLLRYILYGLALVISFNKPYFDFGATVLGLFAIQFTLMFSKIILREV